MTNYAVQFALFFGLLLLAMYLTHSVLITTALMFGFLIVRKLIYSRKT